MYDFSSLSLFFSANVPMHELKAGREKGECYAQSLHAAHFIFKTVKQFPCVWALFLLKVHVLSCRLQDPGNFLLSASCRWELTSLTLPYGK